MKCSGSVRNIKRGCRFRPNIWKMEMDVTKIFNLAICKFRYPQFFFIETISFSGVASGGGGVYKI